MKRLKKYMSIIMALAIITSVLAVTPIQATAASQSFAAVYDGNYDSTTTMKLSVFSVNRENNTFVGYIRIEDEAVPTDSLYEFAPCSITFDNENSNTPDDSWHIEILDGEDD